MKNQLTSLVARDGWRARSAAAHALRAAATALLVLLPVGLGCGDVQLLDEPPGAAGAVGGPETIYNPNEPPPSVCSESEVQCNGAYLERCVQVPGSQVRGWLAEQNCLSPALCKLSPARCEAAACGFGEMRCVGNLPQRCNEELTERQQLGTCASAGHCSLDPEKCAAEGQPTPCCLTNPCEAGELRCNDGGLERCVNGLGFELVVTCATQKLCELSLGSCQSNPASCACQPPTCEVGATRCTGTALEQCNADQTGWEPVGEPCPSPELCELGRQRAVPACESAPCEPNELRCTGASLERCNAGQTGFELVSTCEGGPAFCDSVRGECTTVPCDIGDTRCNGAQVESCLPDRSGFAATDQCDTPQLCQVVNDVAVCRPAACAANAFDCAGSQPMRCNAGQTAMVNAGQPCLRDELCSEFRQRCDFCFPSRRECTPDLRFSRTCAPDGDSFGPLTFCPLGCIAGTGACQTCTVGDYSCQGGVLARCNDGFSFTPLNRASDCSGQNQVSCNGNQRVTTPCGAPGCNTQRNACNQCTGQQRSCADTSSFVTCQPNGTFGPATPCGAGLLCAGAGQCACVANQLSCSGDTLLTCNATGTALVAAARCGGAGGAVLRTCEDGELNSSNCGSAALCSASTGDTCSTCLDGERSCAAGRPQECVAGQQVLEAPCGAGLACVGAGVCSCTVGEVSCSAGALQQCSADGASFEPAAACDDVTLRSCNGNELVTDTCASPDHCLASAAGNTCAQCLESEPPNCTEDLAAELRCVAGAIEQTACGLLGLCVPGVGCL